VMPLPWRSSPRDTTHLPRPHRRPLRLAHSSLPHHRLPPRRQPLSLVLLPPGQAGVGGGGVGAAEAVVDVVLGVVGRRPPRLRLPLSLPFPEVRPGRPSPTRGQGVSPCGPTRVREGGLVPRTSRRPWSRVLPPTRQPGLHLLCPARRGRGVGSGYPGAVLRHCGADAARRHRVDRRLGCLLPHYS
jgi:hypothetical protein